jgi:GNAT superfamily N-acetyltransferase
MPQVAQDEITDINEAVGQRWRSIDPLLPDPGDLPHGCMPPLLARGPNGTNGRPAGLAVCRHQHVPADSLAQTWEAATKFTLTIRVTGNDTRPATDDLLTQWRDHLARQPEAKAADTAATVTWPARDVTGVLALARHGFQPVTVIAARRAGPAHKAHQEDPEMVIRHPGLADLDAVTELELGVIHYDAHFGAAFPRPATPALVKESTRTAIQNRPDWTWLAIGNDGRPVGLAVVEPPDEAKWIAGLTRHGQTAYLSTMYLKPDERGSGTGTKLVESVHDALDTRGIDLTLLHYAQVNPLSAPFWHRMGYRPLWSIWAARPALTAT